MYGMPLKSKVRKMRARLSFDEYWGRLGYDSCRVWRLLHARRRKWSITEKNLLGFSLHRKSFGISSVLHYAEEGLKSFPDEARALQGLKKNV